jgi:hypothetical protein
LKTLAKYGPGGKPSLPSNDFAWLETEFRDFNEANGYPIHLASPSESRAFTECPLAAPSFEITRRYVWETSRKPFRWLLAQLGRPNTKLIDQRSWKRAA